MLMMVWVVGVGWGDFKRAKRDGLCKLSTHNG